METKTKSIRFKMSKSVHKSKPNKISGEKLTYGGYDGRWNVEVTSRGRETMSFCSTIVPYKSGDVGSVDT